MTRRPGYTWQERQRRAAFLAWWRQGNGDLCVGYQRDPHLVDVRTNPLTADHIDPVGVGGAESGALQALCRSCNSTKREGRNRRRGAGGWRQQFASRSW